ncbi:MAG: hypothetical protein B7Z42_03870 [Brevundimonas sp. 12-68-7]|nr:MAG: hypothetical protein B7Z42_03870 [Brevundimonas sp. 12-68-7]
MKPIRSHIASLVGAAFAVLAMLMVSSVSVAAPASMMKVTSDEPCADMTSKKGSPPCSPDCAVICHALLVAPVVVGEVKVFEPVSYLSGYPRLTSVIVEGDDPPPR